MSIDIFECSGLSKQYPFGLPVGMVEPFVSCLPAVNLEYGMAIRPTAVHQVPFTTCTREYAYRIPLKQALPGCFCIALFDNCLDNRLDNADQTHLPKGIKQKNKDVTSPCWVNPVSHFLNTGNFTL